MKKTTVLVADDHPLLAKGLTDFLKSHGFEVLATETNGIKTYHEIIKLKPDIAIIDIEIPDMNGLQILEKSTVTGVSTLFIFITIHRDPGLIRRAFEAGVRGFLLKEYELEEILECIARVLEGKRYYGKLSVNFSENTDADLPISRLTPSEIKILRYIAREYNTREIAEKLFIAEKTVEKHRSNIIKKLGLPPRKNALLLWAITHYNISET